MEKFKQSKENISIDISFIIDCLMSGILTVQKHFVPEQRLLNKLNILQGGCMFFVAKIFMLK